MTAAVSRDGVEDLRCNAYGGVGTSLPLMPWPVLVLLIVNNDGRRKAYSQKSVHESVEK